MKFKDSGTDSFAEVIEGVLREAASRGLTQSKLAEAIGVRQSNVSRLRKYHASIGPDKIMSLVLIVGITGEARDEFWRAYARACMDSSEEADMIRTALESVPDEAVPETLLEMARARLKSARVKPDF